MSSLQGLQAKVSLKRLGLESVSVFGPTKFVTRIVTKRNAHSKLPMNTISEDSVFVQGKSIGSSFNYYSDNYGFGIVNPRRRRYIMRDAPNSGHQGTNWLNINGNVFNKEGLNQYLSNEKHQSDAPVDFNQVSDPHMMGIDFENSNFKGADLSNLNFRGIRVLFRSRGWPSLVEYFEEGPPAHIWATRPAPCNAATSSQSKNV